MNVAVDQGSFAEINGSAVEIERGLIGACLSYPSATHAAMAVVIPDYFREEVHQRLWAGMVELASEGRPVTAVTIGAKLGNWEINTDGLTLRQYIARCATDSFVPAAAVIDFARQVQGAWVQRAVITQCEDVRSAALLPGARPRDLISDLIQELDGFRAIMDGRHSGPRSIGESVAGVADRLNRMRMGEIVETCVSTGLKDLDRKLVGGFKPGELIIIAGRPGMGKSLLAISMSRQMAKAGHAGGFFSMEMLESQTSSRFISDDIYNSDFPISGSQILQNMLSDREAQRVFDAESRLRELPLCIDDSSSLTVGEIGARARNWNARFERQHKKLEFIVIDYLKFVRATDRYRSQRHYEVGEITAGLKALAKDLGIAIVLLVQLNREVEKTADKRPELAHLRESGDIEADADVVMLLFREAYYLANDPKSKSNPESAARLAEVQNNLEIIIAKQRMGSTGSVHVFCHPGSSAVRDAMWGQN